MNTIKLFFNGIDIMPNVLLQHFLHYLGFYVYKVEDDDIKEEIESIADIYVISDEFVRSQSQVLESMNGKKSVLISVNGWSYEDDLAQRVSYEGSNMWEVFLLDIIEALYKIFLTDGAVSLFGDITQWYQTALKVAGVYREYKLLEASLITRCFFKQNQFYEDGIKRYNGFINEIAKFESDYADYVSLFAKYEADLISKTNKYIYCYDTSLLLSECNELLRKYQDNEELHLLRADILFEFEGNWMDGCDRYSDEEVENCSYAYFKRAKILRTYYKEYMNAEVLLKKAIHMNGNYIQLWYQLGECYDQMGRYDKAIKVFKQIYNILEHKYNKAILTPLEWEYLYKSVMRIAIIYKVRLGDYSSAYAFNEQNMFCYNGIWYKKQSKFRFSL